MTDNPTQRTYRVTVIEWLSHVTTVTAADRHEAIEIARELWLNHKQDDHFEFDDADLDTIIADECA